MNAISKVFLTGASGYIGGSVADKLVRNGVKVRGLVRDRAKAELLSARGVEPVLGDLDDDALLIREALQADAVINVANSDHAASARALVTALTGSGKTLIHTSGSSIIGDFVRGSQRSETIYDEDTPFVIHELKQARHDIDLLVLAAAANQVRAIVVCPTLIYGQGRGLNPNSAQLPFLAANAREHGAVQLVGAGLNVWSNVHIDDVVDLFVLALGKAPAGSFYFAENGEASFAQLGDALARRMGLARVESLDPEVAAQRWGVARAYFSFGSNSRVRAARARRELGWSPKHTSAIDWIVNEMPVSSSPKRGA